MQQTPSDHRRAGCIRRSIGASGLILALIIIVCIGVYTYNVRASLFTGPGRNPASPSTPAGTSSVRPVSACKTPPHALGDSSAAITSGELRRSFIVHLAPSYGNQPQPLVVNFHAYSFSARGMARYTNMAAEADKAGFILIFPQGVDNPPSWNAGLGASGPTGSADDIQFTRDLFSFLKTNYCVDSHRVYLTGFSLGGGMAYRLACTLSGQVAAVVTVAGAYYHAPGGCHPSRPVPILEIHGQADRFAPYGGNPQAGMAAVQTYLNVWLDRDRCTSTSKIIYQQGDVTGIEWPHCANGTVVEHYRVSDGGHTWPGAGPSGSLGFTTRIIDANAVIWNFFSRFST